jgi:hypothetical protein
VTAGYIAPMVQPGAGSIAAWCDRLLDTVVLLLVAWTLAYHVCLVLRLGTTSAIVIALALAAVALLVVRHAGWPDRGADSPPLPLVLSPGRPRRRTPHLGRVVLAAAGVAGLAMAVSAPMPFIWVPWLVATLGGALWALQHFGDPTPSAPDDESGESARLATWVVLLWALALAVLSVSIVRPNPDDVFYVNMSQWVAVHGAFPVKDTLFSNYVYPPADWPPVASYDGLVGTVARLLHVHAASVEYMAVPPLATIASVLALWRLLRTWRVRRLAIVFSAAMIFLLFDGTSNWATPGNLWATRLWQGKVILLCLMVPLLLVYALEYADRPSRGRILWIAMGGVACVGLTTSALFVVPLIGVAVAAPLVARSWRQAVAVLVAMSGYALVGGVITVLLGGRSADDFATRKLYRFDPSWIAHSVFLTWLVAVIGVVAVLVGPLLVPHPAARMTTGLLGLWFGIVLVPGVTHASYSVIGLGPTLWRLSWGLTVGALVGVAVAWVAEHGVLWARGHLAGAWGERARHRNAPAVVLIVLLALLVPFGHPIWGGDTAAEWRWPFHWQRSASSIAAVHAIQARTRRGDLVLAPSALSTTLSVATTAIRAVVPELYFMHYLRDGHPGLHFQDRTLLDSWVNHQLPWDAPGVHLALEAVGPRVVCVWGPDAQRARRLESWGYRPFPVPTIYYRCLTAPSEG